MYGTNERCKVTKRVGPAESLKVPSKSTAILGVQSDLYSSEVARGREVRPSPAEGA